MASNFSSNSYASMASVTPLPLREVSCAARHEEWAEAVSIVEAMQSPAALFTLDRQLSHTNAAAVALGLGTRDFTELLASATADEAHSEGMPCRCRAASQAPSDGPPQAGVVIRLVLGELRLLLCVLACCPRALPTLTAPEQKLQRFPPRQARVAALLLRGLTDKEIAHRLGLSHHTVRTYLRQILQRVGAHSRVELVSKLWMPSG